MCVVGNSSSLLLGHLLSLLLSQLYLQPQLLWLPLPQPQGACCTALGKGVFLGHHGHLPAKPPSLGTRGALGVL